MIGRVVGLVRELRGERARLRGAVAREEGAVTSRQQLQGIVHRGGRGTCPAIGTT